MKKGPDRLLPRLARGGRDAVKSAARTFDWRLRRPGTKKSFLVNLGIGLLVGIAFYFMSHLPVLESLFNTTMDKMIYWESYGFLKKWEECRGRSAGARECEDLARKMSDRIVFVDIDDQTLSEWGDPYLIPRDRLARILRLADQNGARVVIFDVLFDIPSGEPGADKALRQVLRDMTLKSSPLDVVFPVLQSKRDGRAKRNIFDDIIDANPRFHRAVPYLSASPSDKIVRYVRYYDTSRGPEGQGRVLWGTHILGAFLYRGDEGALRQTEGAILQDAAKHRQESYVVATGGGRRMTIANGEFFSNRIRFGLIPPGVLGGEGNLFAERMLPDEVEALGENLRGKIVIVGTSSPDKESWYTTPVGDMPGMYVVGNVVNLIVGGWQVRDAPGWLKAAMWLVVIVFAAYMFANLKPSWARVVSTGALFAVFIPVTYYFFSRHNIMINATLLFVNLLLPMLAMGWGKAPGGVATALREGEKDEA